MFTTEHACSAYTTESGMKMIHDISFAQRTGQDSTAQDQATFPSALGAGTCLPTSLANGDVALFAPKVWEAAIIARTEDVLRHGVSYERSTQSTLHPLHCLILLLSCIDIVSRGRMTHCVCCTGSSGVHVDVDVRGGCGVIPERQRPSFVEDSRDALRVLQRTRDVRCSRERAC